jgi:large subunit ribosomal protein L3
MPKGILGKKIGMTQIFSPEGVAIPVTVIEAGPCPVIQGKTEKSDGYNAIQVAFQPVSDRRVNKPTKGHFAKSGIVPHRWVREFRVEADKVVPVGTEIKCDIFNEGEAVDVVGTSKGKGFAGVIKRWNFRRGPMGHGSMYHRRTGSLGATDPARVFKGRKMPGRLGNARITVQNLKVVMVDPERNLILVRGAVPGINGSLVLIKESVKSKK